ncbi:MAG TPA: hypothetical protein G4O03_04845 [Dehalococcoidia bacterium]|jgi:hypothetical protein|nr:hypothetical protein [Dehalococcoidia bacterium]
MFGRKRKKKEGLPPPKKRDESSLFMEIVNLVVDLAKVADDIGRLYDRFRRGREKKP